MWRQLRRGGVSGMKGISPPYVFNLALDVDGLNRLPAEGAGYGDLRHLLLPGCLALLDLNNPDSLYGSHMRSSLQSAGALANRLNPIIQKGDPNQQISSSEVPDIKRLYSDYKIALLAELSSLNTYFVTKKEPYDTWSLLYEGDKLFPGDLASKAPDARFDIQEAGKCLAYEMSTACGFRTFRAMETVLRRYYLHVTGAPLFRKTETSVSTFELWRRLEIRSFYQRLLRSRIFTETH
jgi:hypothetical protein